MQHTRSGQRVGARRLAASALIAAVLLGACSGQGASVIAGGRRSSGLGDGGAARDARLSKPHEVSVSWWSLYDGAPPKAFIADTGNDRVRVFDAFGQSFLPFADIAAEPGAESEIESLLIPSDTPLWTEDERRRPFGRLRGPKGVAAAYDDGHEGLVFIADTGNSRVVGVWYRWTNADSDDAQEPVAYEAFELDAPGAAWSVPQSLAVDACSDAVFVADTGRDRVVAANGSGSWDLGITGLQHPVSVATNGLAAAYADLFVSPVDLSSELYIADDQAGKVFAVDIHDGFGCLDELTATANEARTDPGHRAKVFAETFRRGATASAGAVRPAVSDGSSVSVLPVGGRPVGVEGDGLGGVYVSQARDKRVVHWMPEEALGEIGANSDEVPGGVISKIDHYAGKGDVCPGLPAKSVLAQMDLTPVSLRGARLGAPTGLEVVPLGLLYLHLGGGVHGLEEAAGADLPFGYVLNDVWFADSSKNVLGSRIDVGNDSELGCVGENQMP